MRPRPVDVEHWDLDPLGAGAPGVVEEAAAFKSCEICEEILD